MDENIRQIQKLLDAAEGNLHSARNLLRKYIGDDKPEKDTKESLEKLNTPEPTIVEGIFNGTEMLGRDNKIYQVPSNYASKSKLVEGDVLKLTVADDGSYIFKQIQPVERQSTTGTLVLGDNGSYTVNASGKNYNVLTASVTFYKAQPGDTVTIVVPKEHESTWAVLDNVITKGLEGSQNTTPTASSADLIQETPVENKIVIEQTSVDSDSSKQTTENSSSRAVADEVTIIPPVEQPDNTDVRPLVLEDVESVQAMEVAGETPIEVGQPQEDANTPEVPSTDNSELVEQQPEPLASTQNSEPSNQPAEELEPVATNNSASFQIQYPGGQPTSDDELLAKLKENLAALKTPDTGNTVNESTPASESNVPVDSVSVVQPQVAVEPAVPAQPVQPTRTDQPIAELDI